jgi:superfamily II DNA or RNA helicase
MTEDKMSDVCAAELQLRIYQQEIVNMAQDFNTIAFLPTGSGKTLISCHLIGNRMRIMRETFNRKFIAFIAPTKVLLTQQKTYIEKNCTIKDLKAKEFTGDSYLNNKQIDYWGLNEWTTELKNCEVSTICVTSFPKHLITPFSILSGRIHDSSSLTQSFGTTNTACVCV